ncbi:hypothetical protein ACFL60_07790 [Candidatus Omnitrophota bacterium]
MAKFFRTMGLLTGRALRTRAVNRTLTKAADYIAAEMRLSDIKLKRSLLRKKRTQHLTILGRTVYRLLENDVNPKNDQRIDTLSRVLNEIDGEIESVEQELQRRKEREKQKRASTSN